LGPENRKYIRFETQESIYAALGIHFSKVGKLKDISVCGLSFVYIESKKTKPETDSSIVSIFNPEDNFFLSHLPCRLIYDRSICMRVNELSPKQNYRIKKCGVLFTAIEVDQRKKLDIFLDNYTCGLVPLSKDLKLVQ
jgi:hypothetical protein